MWRNRRIFHLLARKVWKRKMTRNISANRAQLHVLKRWPLHKPRTSLKTQILQKMVTFMSGPGEARPPTAIALQKEWVSESSNCLELSFGARLRGWSYIFDGGLQMENCSNWSRFNERKLRQLKPSNNTFYELFGSPRDPHASQKASVYVQFHSNILFLPWFWMLFFFFFKFRWEEKRLVSEWSFYKILSQDAIR